MELERALWMNGRHNRSSDFLTAVEKHNQSIFDGFRNLRFHKFLLDKDPDGCIDMIRRLLDYGAQIKGPSRQDLGMGSGPG